MTKSEINKKIALLLGFKPYGIRVNDEPNADFGWMFPGKFSDQCCSFPSRSVPDFVDIIYSVMDAGNNIFMSSVMKHDYKTMPNIDDVNEFKKGFEYEDN